MKAFERIENLKRAGKWSFKQIKKQRVAAGLVKTHWDYLMDEMVSMRFTRGSHTSFSFPRSPRNGCELTSEKSVSGSLHLLMSFPPVCASGMRPARKRSESA